MASLSLVFDLLARDHASRAIRNVGDEAEKSGHKLGTIGKVAAGAALGGVVALGAGLATVLKGGAEEFKGNQAAMAQFTAGLKSTGGASKISADQVQALADSIEAKTGTDGAAVVSGAALLETFTKVRNEVGKGNDVFSRATQAGVDLAARGFGSVEGNAVLLGKALNDPLKGLTALGKQGITFTQQQKDTIKQLVATGDTLGAQKIILGEVETQVKGSAEAYGNTLPGQLARASAAFDGVKETVFKSVLPAFTGLLGFLNDTLFPALGKVAGVVGPVFSAVGDGFGKLKDAFKTDGIKGALALVGDTIKDALPTITAKLADLGRAFIDWVGPRIGPLLTEAGKLYLALLGFITGTVYPAVVAKLADLGQAFVEWIGPRIVPLLTKLAELLTKVSTYLRETALPAIEAKLSEWGAALLAWIGPRIGPLLVELGKLLAKLTGFLLGTALPAIITEVGKWAVAIIAWVGPAAITLVVELVKLIGKTTAYLAGAALTAIKDEVAKWASAVVDWVTDAAKKLPGKLAELGTAMRTAFTGKGGLVEKALGLGGDLVDAIVDGIGSAAHKVEDKIKGLLDKLPGISFSTDAKGDGPGAELGTGTGTAARIAAAAVTQFGGRITSGYRSPAENARVGGSSSSFHLDARNPANDIVTSNMQGTFDWIARNYGGSVRELIYAHTMIRNGVRSYYAPDDHFDHVHVAHTGGTVSGDWPRMPGDAADERTVRTQIGEVITTAADMGDLLAAVNGLRSDLRRIPDQLVQYRRSGALV